MAEVACGHVYFGPIASRARGGSELDHFVVVVQIDEVTRASQYVVVVPLTSEWKGQHGARGAVKLVRKGRNAFLKHDSFALCLQPILMDKKRLQHFEDRGALDRNDMTAIKQGLMHLLGVV